MNTARKSFPSIATLGLGGNIGDPPSAMAYALTHIDRHLDCAIVSVSRLYQTPPWGKTDQPDFFNCCAVIRTRLEPHALLDVCLAIERDMKRERIERWGPRAIDIDILTFDDRRSNDPQLVLPHPRMTERAFVLVPLADIAPHLEVDGLTICDWLDQTDTGGITPASEDDTWWCSPPASP